MTTPWSPEVEAAIRARYEAIAGRLDHGPSSATLYERSARDVPTLLARLAEVEAERDMLKAALIEALRGGKP